MSVAGLDAMEAILGDEIGPDLLARFDRLPDVLLADAATAYINDDATRCVDPRHGDELRPFVSRQALSYVALNRAGLKWPHFAMVGVGLGCCLIRLVDAAVVAERAVGERSGDSRVRALRRGVSSPSCG